MRRTSSPKKHFTIRIPEDVLEALKSKAKAQDRSASWFMIQALRKAAGVK